VTEPNYARAINSISKEADTSSSERKHKYIESVDYGQSGSVKSEQLSDGGNGHVNYGCEDDNTLHCRL
jgi:hypothetical protein